MQKELKKLGEVIEEWGVIPLAVDCPNELTRLDEQMDEWYGKVEKAFEAVRLAADRFINA